MRLRRLAAAFLLTFTVTGCSDDEPAPEPASSSNEEANPDATLPSAVLRAVAPAHLRDACPGGHFTRTDDVLGTFPDEYAGRAKQLLSYDCDDLADQMVWAAMPDADLAGEAAEHADGAPTFVAGSTVLVLAPRLVDEAGLDVAGFFEALAGSCGCGSEIRSGP